MAIDAFVEKPDAKTAAQYLESGYLWNAGNFLFRADVFLEEYASFDSRSAEAVARAVKNATRDLGFRVLDADAFSAAAKLSVDFAVMEKTKRGAVVPADYGWSDVGGWNAVWALSSRDPHGNATRGTVTLHDVANTLVTGNRGVTALLGVEDLIVVVEDDAVLVAGRDRAEDLGPLVDSLRKAGRPEADIHSRVHRPWGSYQNLDRGERFLVKRIVVEPGRKLSLQRHNHRAEHWVVVRGIARVTIEDKVRDLKENESAFVPIGAVHRLENPGTEAAGVDRGPDRRSPQRRRHRAPRGRLQPRLARLNALTACQSTVLPSLAETGSMPRNIWRGPRYSSTEPGAHLALNKPSWETLRRTTR